MCEGLGVGDVVDGHELNIAVVQRGAHDVAPDAAEAVDTYLDGHSSSGGVWNCGRASHANFSHAAKLKMLWAAPTKVNAAHDCSLGKPHCGYCLMLVTRSPMNRTKTVFEGGW